MNILLVSQYFYPEPFIINDLIKSLVDQGHQVEVLTGKPNYPDGLIYPGYEASKRVQEYYAGNILVHRVPIYPRKKGVINRLLNYLSFVLSGLLYFYPMIKGKKFDVIFVYMPSPVTSIIPAIYLKKRLKRHLAVWIQDLWPETLSATGFVKNKYILYAVGKLVKWIYGNTDTLLVQSEAFHEPMSRYASPDRIIYYPNSFLEFTGNNILTEALSEDLTATLKRHFCFVFAGNLGTAQSLETIIEAARFVQHLSDCLIVLVGSGSMSEWLLQQIKEKRLNNIVLAGRFPSEQMSEIFSLAKALLVTLKQNDTFTYVIPSKIQTYLAAGRPIVAAINGEGAKVIQQAGAGLVSRAEDAVELARNIEELYHMPSLKREELGGNGREYFLKHFEMMGQVKRLVNILEKRAFNRSELV